MTSLSLREAAEQAGVGKSTIWRAIKAGRMSAARTDDGGFAIDPAELFRVFQPGQSAGRAKGQDTTAAPAPGTDSETRAALEVEVRLLREMLDAMRSDRDAWRDQAAKVIAGLPAPAPAPMTERRPWWRWRMAG